jgi:CheY-like chemotaxis protein
MALAHKLLKPFISALLSLSIEMQKAQNLSHEENIVSEAETHADMANNLSAAGDLIVDNEYEKAQHFIEEMGESNSPDMFMNILNLLSDKKYEEAADLVNALREKHVESISRLTETDLSKKVLAVDDRPEILSFVTGTLKNHYKVYGATSGEKALKVLEAQKCDLFILDIDMPGMNGYELAETLRKSDDYAKTPIIFLTGNSSRDRIMKAIEVGGNDFIVKPANYETLLAKASKFLNKQ